MKNIFSMKTAFRVVLVAVAAFVGYALKSQNIAIPYVDQIVDQAVHACTCPPPAVPK